MRIWAKAWRGSFSTCVDIVSVQAKEQIISLTVLLVSSSREGCRDVETGNKTAAAKWYQRYTQSSVVRSLSFFLVFLTCWRLALSLSLSLARGGTGISNLKRGETGGPRNHLRSMGRVSLKLVLARWFTPSELGRACVNPEESLQTGEGREGKRQAHRS